MEIGSRRERVTNAVVATLAILLAPVVFMLLIAGILVLLTDVAMPN